MIDKVQKIRSYLADMANADGAITVVAKAINKEILPYIDSMQEEPISGDLEEAAKRYALNNTPYEDCTDEMSDAFKVGANWQKEQFEKNRLEHCNSITNEQAELEQGFIDQHLDKYQRMPTFLDAIEYGMRLQKEQLMAKAVEKIINKED